MTALELALRSALVMALTALVGVPATLATVIYPELRDRELPTAAVDRLSRRLLGGAVVAALVSATLLDLPRAAGGGLEGIRALELVVGTEVGGAWLALVGAAVVSGAGIALSTKDTSRRLRRAGAAATTVGTLAMLLAFCWTRYSTAVDSSGAAILVKFAHMSGAALWVGGLLVMSALPAVLPDDAAREPRALAARLIRRFSMVAVVGVTLTVITGILIASWHVRSAESLVTTPYGITLLAKVLLVGFAATIGGFNRLVLHGRMRPKGDDGVTQIGHLPAVLAVGTPLAADPVASFVRAVRAELVVLVAVLLASVLLTAGLEPSYVVAEAGRRIVHLRNFVDGFPDLLRLAGVTAAVAGSLVLGYELGEFETHRR